jgi:multidrug efflux system membrane fusion protein
MAVQRGPQGTYVYLAQKDNSVKIRPVTMALTSGNSVGITKGLQAGDVVVVDGQDKLQDGSKIEARNSTGGSTSPQGEQAQDQDEAPSVTPASADSPQNSALPASKGTKQ